VDGLDDLAAVDARRRRATTTGRSVDVPVQVTDPVPAWSRTASSEVAGRLVDPSDGGD
jgi:hypothetical protein